MKTRRFDFNWKPLQLQVSFSVDGSVPDNQNYNADTGEYTPDYTLTPLILQPIVSVIDKDEIISSGKVNSNLTNIKWYENINGTKTLINTDNSNYEITQSGDLAGRIKVKKNSEPKNPTTLIFYAEYLDNRTGQIFTIQGSYLIKCGSSASSVRVELNAAEQTIYNPLTDERTQTVKATVWVGDKPCESSKYKLVWEVMDGDAWREVGTDDVMDYDTTVNNDGTLTIDKWLMGTDASIRCRVKYSADGNPDSVSLTDASPNAVASFVRRIPKYEFDITGVPYNIPSGTMSIAPEALIMDTNGKIDNAENELLPLWYIATNKASESLSYSLVGNGTDAVISTSAMDLTYGAVVGLDVVDRGYAGAWTDSADDSVFCDADGSVLIIH